MKKSNYSQLISLIFTATRIIQEKIKNKGTSRFFCSPLKMETLRFIKKQGNPLMKEVAEYLCITPPSATSIIDHLVESNFIARQVDKKDRRTVRLVITPKGEKILKQSLDQKIKHLEQILSKLNPKEQDNLIKILKKLSNI